MLLITKGLNDCMNKPEDIAREYWASFLGSEAGALFGLPLAIVNHGQDLADYHGVFALFRDGKAIVSLPPDHHHTAHLRDMLSGLNEGCAPAEFAAALSSIAETVIGPAYIGYAEVITPLEHKHDFRVLGHDDAEAVQTLQQACDPAEWEHGGSPCTPDHPCSGVFVDGRLVALAGYEVWGGRIAHISIVTHPGFRGQGFGRTAVAHLADRAINAGLLPQYRTLEANTASVRLAGALGFRRYANSVAVRL